MPLSMVIRNPWALVCTLTLLRTLQPWAFGFLIIYIVTLVSVFIIYVYGIGCVHTYVHTYLTYTLESVI